MYEAYIHNPGVASVLAANAPAEELTSCNINKFVAFRQMEPYDPSHGIFTSTGSVFYFGNDGGKTRFWRMLQEMVL